MIDLYVDDCPLAAMNFLKLCLVKYYNNCLFYNVQSNFIAQTGDPTGTGRGGSSIYGLLNGDGEASFKDEIRQGRKVDKVGLVGMAHFHTEGDSNRSQFFFTLRGEDMEQFEKTHTIFGEVAEGIDVLATINSLYCDGEGRPYQDVRIRHTYILDDPFPDPPGLEIPSSSHDGEVPNRETVKRRLPYEEKLGEELDEQTARDIEESIRRNEAKSRAIVLEMTGDLPDADVKPPAEVLFVCKLNAATTSEDLELIFSRFGAIKSCEVIRDFKTGDSLNYAFIEFEAEGACIEAYHKMNNVLIDDRRIKVDFSQSVSKLWNRFLLQPRSEATSSKPRSRPMQLKVQPASHYERGMGVPALKSSALDDHDTMSSRADDHRQKDNSYSRADDHRQKDRSYSRADDHRQKDNSYSRADDHRQKDNSYSRADDHRQKDNSYSRADDHRNEGIDGRVHVKRARNTAFG